MKISIYTDGSSRGNPGPGGYGVLLESGNHSKRLAGGFANTTNNRMELMAVIVGLEAIKAKNADITIYSDSTYVIKALNEGWLKRWESKGFKKVKNPDLWTRFLEIYSKHNVSFVWVKGHSGHLQNEICDKLATNASSNPNLPQDEGYSPDSDATVQTLPL